MQRRNFLQFLVAPSVGIVGTRTSTAMAQTQNRIGNHLKWTEVSAFDKTLGIVDKRSNAKLKDLFDMYDSFVSTYSKIRVSFSQGTIGIINNLNIFPQDMFWTDNHLDVLKMSIDSITKNWAPLVAFWTRFNEVFRSNGRNPELLEFNNIVAACWQFESVVKAIRNS
jgi:hypothetical protein